MHIEHMLHIEHVATLRKLAHTKRIECVVAGTVSKSSAHDATLKIEVVLSLLHDARILPSSCTTFPQAFIGELISVTYPRRTAQTM